MFCVGFVFGMGVVFVCVWFWVWGDLIVIYYILNSVLLVVCWVVMSVLWV